jgi:hypothetical protein
MSARRSCGNFLQLREDSVFDLVGRVTAKMILRVTQPYGEAVQKEELILEPQLQEERGDRQRFFECVPMRRSIMAVPRNSLAHLIVTGPDGKG